MPEPPPADSTERILAQQAAYYRAVAREYEQRALPEDGIDEVRDALNAFGPAGDVLELACGTVRRRLFDGTPHRVGEVPHTPAELEARLRAAGWNIEVHPTRGAFYCGAGHRG